MLFDDLMMPRLAAGIDEVGRGPLAGPVVAAAVILAADRVPAGLKDSKKMTPQQREKIASEIRRIALCWCIGRAEVAEIDEINILRASHLAMQRAVAGLPCRPQLLLVDGNLLPSFAVPALAVVKGDDRIPAISAASVLAKVERDAEMVKLAESHPGYGFERHKGYATRVHLDALAERGPTPIHRRSFAPVRLSFARIEARVDSKTGPPGKTPSPAVPLPGAEVV